eukprot:CAMPEP_0175047358 /NCGR_PEP_ID=MMETSP0052_2-20121109/5545_1 /TAXON_ID=51329 ORGANISM="Polytomella parva, Strain SAG 63-3" /NCGR_SAMPLE_ID=MMETSP0052_2 /ASSEMBLY_ACC=CAM_ASM_000194 /LENGTH=150 /DNA_ID=CAMNT_0016311213 /DNA_START=33 /DNA_END=482 /DNA_ORIENTATION=-
MTNISKLSNPTAAANSHASSLLQPSPLTATTGKKFNRTLLSPLHHLASSSSGQAVTASISVDALPFHASSSSSSSGTVANATNATNATAAVSSQSHSPSAPMIYRISSVGQDGVLCLWEFQPQPDVPPPLYLPGNDVGNGPGKEGRAFGL